MRLIYTDDEVETLAMEAQGQRYTDRDAALVEDDVTICTECGAVLIDEARCSQCGRHQ